MGGITSSATSLSKQNKEIENIRKTLEKLEDSINKKNNGNKKNNDKPRKKTVSFSKKLAVAITGLFFISYVFFLVVWLLTGNTSPELLTAVATPFGVVISGYFAKGAVENYTKIRESDEYGNPRNPAYGETGEQTEEPF